MSAADSPVTVARSFKCNLCDNSQQFDLHARKWCALCSAPYNAPPPEAAAELAASRLLRAARARSVEEIEKLLAAGVSPDSALHGSLPAIYCCLKTPDYADTNLCNLKSRFGCRRYHSAALLLEAGARQLSAIDQRTDFGLLHLAFWHDCSHGQQQGQRDFIRLLLDNGVSLYHCSAVKTLFDAALQWRPGECKERPNLDSLRLVVAYGLDPREPDQPYNASPDVPELDEDGNDKPIKRAAWSRDQLAVGSMVDAKDSQDRWLRAAVIAKDSRQGKPGSGSVSAAGEFADWVHLHYVGWTSMWDEWLPTDSQRIQAPLSMWRPSSSHVWGTNALERARSQSRMSEPFFRDHKGQWLSNDVVLKALEQGLADLAARRRDIGDRVEGAVPALPAAVVRLVCMYLP